MKKSFYIIAIILFLSLILILSACVTSSSTIRETNARVNELINNGIESYNSGDYDRAIRYYNDALRISPYSSAALNNRGACYTELGDYEKAITDYTEAIRHSPRRALFYDNRGMAYERNGDLELAARDYIQAIQIDENYTRAKTRALALSRNNPDLDPVLFMLYGDYRTNAIYRQPNTDTYFHISRTINSYIIFGYYGAGGAIEIPNEINGISVSIINDDAFRGKNITSVVIDNNIRTIGHNAFADNPLTSLTIGARRNAYGFGRNSLGDFTAPYCANRGLGGTYTRQGNNWLYNGTVLREWAVIRTAPTIKISSVNGRDILINSPFFGEVYSQTSLEELSRNYRNIQNFPTNSSVYSVVLYLMPGTYSVEGIYFFTTFTEGSSGIQYSTNTRNWQNLNIVGGIEYTLTGIPVGNQVQYGVIERPISSPPH